MKNTMWKTFPSIRGHGGRGSKSFTSLAFASVQGLRARLRPGSAVTPVASPTAPTTTTTESTKKMKAEKVASEILDSIFTFTKKGSGKKTLLSADSSVASQLLQAKKRNAAAAAVQRDEEEAGKSSHAAEFQRVMQKYAPPALPQSIVSELLLDSEPVIKKYDINTNAKKSPSIISRTSHDTLVAEEQRVGQEDWFVGQVYQGDHLLLHPNVDAATTNTTLVRNPEERWAKSSTPITTPPVSERSGLLELDEIVQELEAERGGDIKVLDLRSLGGQFEFLILATGRSNKHIHNMIDAVRRIARNRIAPDQMLDLPPNVAIEGTEADGWMVLDLGRFVIHGQTASAREYYDLEGLWYGQLSDSNQRKINYFS